MADIFLLLSEKESFGLAALEAMACEVPVISSNAGGIPEVNIHGVTGYVSKIGDIDDMVANTVKILTDETLHLQMRANALSRAKDFSLEKILPMYERYYEKIVGQSWRFPTQKFTDSE